MSKLGDLIVRLRLKHEDYERGLDKSKKKTQSFGQLLGKTWKTAALKVAAVTAAIAGTLKIMDRLAHTTQVLGDAWDRTVAGMKARWETFLNAVATGDFTDIFGRMEERAQAARELAKAIDAIGEAETAAALSEAKNKKHYLDLLEIARNSNKEAFDRIAAVTEMREIVEQNTKGLVKAYGDAAEKATDAFLIQIDKSLKNKDITEEMRSQIKDFLIWMGNQDAGFEEADFIVNLKTQLRAAEKEISRLERHGFNAEPMRAEADRLRREIEKLTREYKNNGFNLDYLNRLFDYKFKITNKVRKELEKYVKASSDVSNAAQQQSIRLTTLQNTLLGTAKSVEELTALLPALGEGFAELYLRETDLDFIGPMQPKVKQVYDMMQSLANGGGGGHHHGGHRKSEVELYADSLKKMRELYEKHDRWKNSYDLQVIRADRELYAALAENGATYYDYLVKARNTILSKDKPGKNDAEILGLLNDELARLTQFPAIKLDDTQLQEFDDSVLELADDLFDLEEEKIELPSPTADFSTFEEYEAWLNRIQEAAARCNDSLKQSIVDGISGSIEYLANSLFGLEQFNAAGLVNALLEPIADAAITMGGLIMMEGLSVEAFKASLTNPAAAVAMGSALMMAGAIAKAGLKAAINKATGTTSVPSGYSGGTAGESTQTMQTELTIYIKGRLSGSDIVLSGQRTLNEWSK